MDANNINTGVSQINDEFQWFKPTGGAHVEGVKISAPDFSIPPTPASSYSNLHVVLDTVHQSSETITRGMIAPHSHTHVGRPYSGPSDLPVSSSFTPAPSAPSMTSKDIPSFSFSSTSPSLYDNKLDDVPVQSFRAVPEAVNPELPGARAQDALTSLKSEIAPMPTPFVPLEEFDDLAERTDRQLPESVDLSLTDESQKWSDNWNKIGDDVRHKNWNLHHYTPERDSFWGKQWNTVGNDIKNKSWNLKRFRPLPSTFKLNSWLIFDKLENAERQWRESRGINGLWSGRMNRVHHELLNSVAPIGWAQWFINLKNKIANKSSDMINSAAELKEAAGDLIDAVEEEASIDYNAAKDSTKGFFNKVADNLAADYEIAKDAAKDLANSVADTVSADLTLAKDAAKGLANSVADTVSNDLSLAKGLANSVADTVATDLSLAKDAAKNVAGSVANTVATDLSLAKDAAKDLANSASDAIANEVVYLTTTPLPKYNGSLWSGSEFYAPVLNRKVPAEIIAMEEKERADRMTRGINPVVSGMWHRLGRQMLHTYRDDLAELFSGLRNKLVRKGSDMVESAKDALRSYETIKAPRELAAPRGSGYEYEPINFNFAMRVPYEIINKEEAERSDRIKRGINPIVSGLWYRLGLELKYKFSIRPTLASTASMVAEVASDLAGRAASTLSDLSGAVIEKSKDLLTPAPVAEFAEHGAPLNLFAYSAEPVDFTFKSRRTPADIIAMEEKERSDRIAEGVDVLAYSKWNSLLAEPHKTLVDAPSMTASVLPTLSAAKDSLVQSGKGISGYFGSWAHSITDKASSMLDAAKHSHLAEAAMEYVHPDPSSTYSLNKAEEAERVRRMNDKVDPMFAARHGRVQEELLHTIRSV